MVTLVNPALTQETQGNVTQDSQLGPFNAIPREIIVKIMEFGGLYLALTCQGMYNIGRGPIGNATLTHVLTSEQPIAKKIETIRDLLVKKTEGIDFGLVNNLSVRIAAGLSDNETLLELLDRKSVNPSACNNQTLILACRYGNLKGVKALLEKIDISHSPDIFLEAMEGRNLEVASLVLAKLDKKLVTVEDYYKAYEKGLSELGSLIAETGTFKSYDIDNPRFFIAACCGGISKIVEDLLIEDQKKLFITTEIYLKGCASAAREGKDEVLKILLTAIDRKVTAEGKLAFINILVQHGVYSDKTEIFSLLKGHAPIYMESFRTYVLANYCRKKYKYVLWKPDPILINSLIHSFPRYAAVFADKTLFEKFEESLLKTIEWLRVALIYEFGIKKYTELDRPFLSDKQITAEKKRMDQDDFDVLQKVTLLYLKKQKALPVFEQCPAWNAYIMVFKCLQPVLLPIDKQ